jgi:Lon protease-like protein
MEVELDGAAEPVLIRELQLQAPDQRHLGIVLPRAAETATHEAIFPIGTVARVIALEAGEGSRWTLRLQGVCRFEVSELTAIHPFRRARVRPLEEPRFADDEAWVRDLRERIGRRLLQVHAALGEAFPLRRAELDTLLEGPFEALVNQTAQSLDVPTERKLELLQETISERAGEVLGILRSQVKLMELLSPFRHLTASAERN